MISLRKAGTTAAMVAVMACVPLATTGAEASAAPHTSQSTPTSSVGSEATATAESVRSTQTQLSQKGVKPAVTQSGSVLQKTYTEGGGKVVTVTTEPAPAKTGTVTPQISVGFGTGVYIRLNQADQQAAANGAAAFITGAICAATAGIGCVAAGTVAAVAISYVGSYGLCSGDLEIKLSYTGQVLSSKCL